MTENRTDAYGAGQDTMDFTRQIARNLSEYMDVPRGGDSSMGENAALERDKNRRGASAPRGNGSDYQGAAGEMKDRMEELGTEENSKNQELREERSQKKTGKAKQGRERASKPVSKSSYLKYIADLRRADSELALAKAESAELVRQMDNYKEHYEEYEQIIEELITKHDEKLLSHLENLKEISTSIEGNSETLSTRIDEEIQRLAASLGQSIRGSIQESFEMELAKVEEATRILHEYSEKVVEQSIQFDKRRRVQSILFLIGSITSPIVLILMILQILQIL